MLAQVVNVQAFGRHKLPDHRPWIAAPRPAAPEIDGNLCMDEGTEALPVGNLMGVEVDETSEYGLWGRISE